MKKIIKLIILLFFIGNSLCGQSSFNKELIWSSQPYLPILPNQVHSENANYSLLGSALVDLTHDGFLRPLYIIDLDDDGNVVHNWGVASEDYPLGWQRVGQYRRHGDYRLLYGIGRWSNALEQEGVSALFMVNTVTGDTWARQCAEKVIARSAVDINLDQEVLLARYLPNDGFDRFDQLGLSLLDLETGLEYWGYQYSCQLETPSGGVLEPLHISRAGDGENFVLSARLSFPNTNHFSRFFLLQLNTAGEILNSVTFGNTDFVNLLEQHVSEEGFVYLSGITRGVDSFYNDSVILKLDSDFNIAWGKRLRAEHYDAGRIHLALFQDESLLFIQTTNVDLPVISGKVSNEGELFWTKGYSFFLPQVSVTNDESILMGSSRKYDENGGGSLAYIVTKTDPDGEVEGCPQFDACLELSDFTIPLDSVSWERTPAIPLPSMAVNIVDFAVETVPHCGTPSPPSAYFVYPDTLCQSQCASATELRNSLAHYTEWHLTGPNLDTISGENSFSWCFSEPGTYLLSQEVWLLGCSEYFDQEIVVLADDLAPLFPQDSIIFCPDEEVLLVPQSSRPLRSFLWSDGSTSSALSPTDSDWYAVEVSDGYCSIADSALVQFWTDLYPDTVLYLPEQQIICTSDLPYLLQPISVYTDEFVLAGESEVSNEFMLTHPGSYEILATVDGCLFSTSLLLEAKDCDRLLYLPNAFSPNDDGVNDYFEPLGEHFTGISLEIYDRWGKLVLSDTTAPFRWDGKNASSGVYAAVFYYRNELTGKGGLVSGDVLLIR